MDDAGEEQRGAGRCGGGRRRRLAGGAAGGRHQLPHTPPPLGVRTSTPDRERIFVELMTSDRKFKALLVRIFHRKSTGGSSPSLLLSA